jgi:hypothetical protein
MTVPLAVVVRPAMRPPYNTTPTIERRGAADIAGGCGNSEDQAQARVPRGGWLQRARDQTPFATYAPSDVGRSRPCLASPFTANGGRRRETRALADHEGEARLTSASGEDGTAVAVIAVRDESVDVHERERVRYAPRCGRRSCPEIVRHPCQRDAGEHRAERSASSPSRRLTRAASAAAFRPAAPGGGAVPPPRAARPARPA